MEECANFGSVECGQSSTVVVHIRNTSNAHCLYQVTCTLLSMSITHYCRFLLILSVSLLLIVPVVRSNLIPSILSFFISLLINHTPTTGSLKYSVTTRYFIINPSCYSILNILQEPLTLHAIGSAYTDTIRPGTVQYSTPSHPLHVLCVFLCSCS